MAAVSGIMAFTSEVCDYFFKNAEAQNKLCWIAGICWIICAVVFAFEFWCKKEISVIKAVLIIFGFGLALSVLRLLLVTSGIVTNLAMHSAFGWASVGLSSVSLFLVGVLLLLKAVIIVLESHWKQTKILWMVTLGLVLMAVAVIFITGFGLLSVGQAVVIMFSVVALAAAAISCLVVFVWRLIKYLLDLNEVVHNIKH